MHLLYMVLTIVTNLQLSKSRVFFKTYLKYHILGELGSKPCSLTGSPAHGITGLHLLIYPRIWPVLATVLPQCSTNKGYFLNISDNSAPKPEFLS